MANQAQATAWNSPIAKEMAREISSISGLYCGPASVAWIAAVWNRQQGRPYDYQARLKNKTLFPDGPRAFTFNVPGFQLNLNELLRRETQNELQLGKDSYYRYNAIHDSLKQSEMPIIVRILAPKFREGLHYSTIFKAELQAAGAGIERIRLIWQDNGLTTNYHEGNPGLRKTDWMTIGSKPLLWGAKRVVVV